MMAGNKYADLSQECLYYIGGIIKHAKALNGFTNPSTNSYKRLVPGFEAPVLPRLFGAQPFGLLSYSVDLQPEGEARRSAFPRSDGQPLLRLRGDADGRPRRHPEQDRPGQAMDKDLYDLPPKELKKIPTVCGSLREALSNLDKDRAFLKAGDVFSDDLIDSYIELKMTEVHRFEMTPHPVEFDMYYSL